MGDEEHLWLLVLAARLLKDDGEEEDEDEDEEDGGLGNCETSIKGKEMSHKGASKR